jgi:hypothetical protein
MSPVTAPKPDKPKPKPKSKPHRPKSGNETRKVWRSFTVTPTENERIIKRAEKFGISASTYIRFALFHPTRVGLAELPRNV